MDEVEFAQKGDKESREEWRMDARARRQSPFETFLNALFAISLKRKQRKLNGANFVQSALMR